MSYQKVERAGVLVLAFLLTLVVFVPIGVYLQWFVPRDFPPFACLYPSIGVSILVVALTVWHKSRIAPRMQWPMRVGAVCLFVLCVLLMVVTSVPPISRRVGPWKELRGILVEKSQEVVEARAALSIPTNRQLTGPEMDQIENMVFDPVPTYTFPIINRTVHVRMMSRVPPYVGVDFQGGRRAVFDLATMMVIYAD
jgi:hypothetical protein